jgi:hypothetical protein
VLAADASKPFCLAANVVGVSNAYCSSGSFGAVALIMRALQQVCLVAMTGMFFVDPVRLSA